LSDQRNFEFNYLKLIFFLKKTPIFAPEFRSYIMNCKKRKIAGYILSGLVTLIFVATGAMKFTGGEQNVKMAELVGGQTTLFILGGLQLLFALLFWIPRTAVVGFLLMACYMAGAMATHLVIKEPFGLQAGIETLIWVTGFVRFPELTQRLCPCNNCKQ
jgi:putative membrane protein